MVHFENRQRGAPPITSGGAPNRQGRILDATLDVAVAPLREVTTAPRGRTGHRSRDQCRSPVAVDSCGRGQERETSGGTGASLFLLARSRRQRGSSTGPPAIVGRSIRPGGRRRRGPAGLASDRKGFLRTVGRRLRAVPVPRDGQALGKRLKHPAAKRGCAGTDK